MGLLTVVDHEKLAAACQEWARWVRAERVLTTEGTPCTNARGRPVARPEVAIGRDALAAFNRFAAQFGLSPSDRARLQVLSVGSPEEDPFA